MVYIRHIKEENMLTEEAKKLFDKYSFGNKNVHLSDILKKQMEMKRLPKKKLQCNHCIHRNCVYNNTEEQDFPKKGEWKKFNLCEGSLFCKDLKEE